MMRENWLTNRLQKAQCVGTMADSIVQGRQSAQEAEGFIVTHMAPGMVPAAARYNSLSFI